MVKHCAVIHEHDSATALAAMTLTDEMDGGSDSGRDGGEGAGGNHGNTTSAAMDDTMGNTGRGDGGAVADGLASPQQPQQQQQQQPQSPPAPPPQQQQQQQQRPDQSPCPPGPSQQSPQVGSGPDGAAFQGARPRGSGGDEPVADPTSAYLATAVDPEGPDKALGSSQADHTMVDNATSAAAQVLATVASSAPFSGLPLPALTGQTGGLSTHLGGSPGGPGVGGPGAAQPGGVGADDRGRGAVAGRGGGGAGTGTGVNAGAGGASTREGGGTASVGRAGGDTGGHVCHICGLGFREASVLNEHERVVHGLPF